MFQNGSVEYFKLKMMNQVSLFLRGTRDVVFRLDGCSASSLFFSSSLLTRVESLYDSYVRYDVLRDR